MKGNDITYRSIALNKNTYTYTYTYTTSVYRSYDLETELSTT